MKIQSLSIVVPTKRCINNCKFCVSRLHDAPYDDQIEGNWRFMDLYVAEYVRRLNYARDNGCNALMLTGNGEPQQNRRFLEKFGFMVRMMNNPFVQIEMQTTGAGLDEEYLRFLRNWVGVNVISLSISSFNSDRNYFEYIGASRNVVKHGLPELCELIKRYGFTLRLSINLTNDFNDMSPEDTLYLAKEHGADQVTFRILYQNEDNGTEEKKRVNDWIAENRLATAKCNDIWRFCERVGKPLRILEYGATAYSIDEMSVVVDGDCMAQEKKMDTLKYLILQPDCKLYSQWDDKASLIF